MPSLVLMPAEAGVEDQVALGQDAEKAASGVQAQSLPQLHGAQSHLFTSRLVQAQGGVQRHAWLMVWSVIGTS